MPSRHLRLGVAGAIACALALAGVVRAALTLIAASVQPTSLEGGRPLGGGDFRPFAGAGFQPSSHASGMFTCGQCHTELDPADANVVYAVSFTQVPVFGAGTRVVEGLGDYFHESCFASEALPRLLKPKP
jgi:hypothetical protein